MIEIRDTFAREEVTFYCAKNRNDLYDIKDFVLDNSVLAMDTESTGLNCYRPDWRLRTFQIGNEHESFVVPAKFTSFIKWVMVQSGVKLIGHNGPHDIRCVDTHLGFDTGATMAETYIPSQYRDARGKRDGGIGHSLKELAAYLDKDAGKWEKTLKQAFKTIEIPIPGEVYKSGQKKGQPKVRKAKVNEGWGLIPLYHPAYVAYAAADPLLTFRVWKWLKSYVENNRDLYLFDKKVAQACDTLQRRAMLLDVAYTERLSAAYLRKADRLQQRVNVYSLNGTDVNINSTAELADILLDLGVKLKDKTETGKWKVDADILRALLDAPSTNAKVKDFIHCVLVIKQVLKRRTSYTEAMLRERDVNDRVHPSINSLAARTTRMSVSNPALQQLPTKDHEDELMWEVEAE